MHAFSSFTAQIWDGINKLSEISGLSIDGAREICRAAPLTGHSGRVWCDAPGTDYNEVYAADGTVRRGRFGETTIIKLA